MRLLPAAALALLACAGPAPAEEGAGGVYKCTAENGAVTYSTSPCKGAKREYLSREKLEGKLSVIEFPKPEAEKPAESAAGAPVAATAAGAGKPQADSAAASGSAIAPTLPANPQIRKLPVGGGKEAQKK